MPFKAEFTPPVRHASWDALSRLLGAVGRRRRRDRIRAHRGLPGRPVGLLALTGVLLGVLAVAAVLGDVNARRRTDEAPVTITFRRFQVGGGTKEQLPRGWYLEYAYVVDGREYHGAGFRTWADVEAYRPKVCFDPRVPADHLLVQGSFRCGQRDGFEP